MKYENVQVFPDLVVPVEIPDNPEFDDKGQLLLQRIDNELGFYIKILLIDGSEYGGAENFTVVWSFTAKDEYIGGDAKFAKELYERGVIPQYIDENRNVCQIGFCEKMQCWVGWSHRAITSFYADSEVKKGDCAFQPANEEEFKESVLSFWSDKKYHESTWADFAIEVDEEPPHTKRKGYWVKWKHNEKVPNEKLRGQIGGTFCPFPEKWGRGEWKATSLDDAKQMAIDFAEGVG